MVDSPDVIGFLSASAVLEERPGRKYDKHRSITLIRPDNNCAKEYPPGKDCPPRKDDPASQTARKCLSGKTNRRAMPARTTLRH